jgi:hypothetical protein
MQLDAGQVMITAQRSRNNLLRLEFRAPAARDLPSLATILSQVPRVVGEGMAVLRGVTKRDRPLVVSNALWMTGPSLGTRLVDLASPLQKTTYLPMQN